jgi:hypothetical protein
VYKVVTFDQTAVMVSTSAETDGADIDIFTADLKCRLRFTKRGLADTAEAVLNMLAGEKPHMWHTVVQADDAGIVVYAADDLSDLPSRLTCVGTGRGPCLEFADRLMRCRLYLSKAQLGRLAAVFQDMAAPAK